MKSQKEYELKKRSFWYILSTSFAESLVTHFKRSKWYLKDTRLSWTKLYQEQTKWDS